MTFINMNVINFYQSNSFKTISCDDRDSSTRICNIFIVDENYKKCQIFEFINQTNESVQNYDSIEILNMIILQFDESFDSYDKMKTIVNDDRLNVAIKLFDFIISTKIENIVYTTNEHRIDREHNCIDDDTSQNLSNFDELLFDVIESQKSQSTKKNDVHLKMLNENFDRVIKND